MKLKVKAKMTRSGENGSCKIDCYDCPLSIKNNDETLCTVLEAVHPEKAVGIVEKWAAEHPVKTRQSEFLKMFPKARKEGGIISIDPCDIVKSMSDNCEGKYCDDCRQEYWNQEVDDDE